MKEPVDKISSFFYNAPYTLIEINETGEVMNLSRIATQVLPRLLDTFHCEGVCDLLECIEPQIVKLLQEFQPPGIVCKKDFMVALAGDEQESCFHLTVNKASRDSIVIRIEDNTEKHYREKAMLQSEIDKALAEGKYEIASEVLHDIGNAVVGFGAYLNRTNRMLDKDKNDNLRNVAVFVKNVQPQLATSLGADKANALVTLMEGIAKIDKENKDELRKLVADQMNIISHIQEILTIQRQYVVGHEMKERKPVKLKQVIDDCISMLFASFDKKGIQVNIYLDSNDLPEIKGDRTKLMQVILNLLKNSVEAIDMEEEVKKIDIYLHRENHTIQLVIKDTGKGFEPHLAAGFFKRGYTTKSSGTGLGLYNCKQIIEAHSGTIKMYSDGVGKGSVTEICFP